MDYLNRGLFKVKSDSYPDLNWVRSMTIDRMKNRFILEVMEGKEQTSEEMISKLIDSRKAYFNLKHAIFASPILGGELTFLRAFRYSHCCIETHSVIFGNHQNFADAVVHTMGFRYSERRQIDIEKWENVEEVVVPPKGIDF